MGLQNPRLLINGQTWDKICTHGIHKGIAAWQKQLNGKCSNTRLAFHFVRLMYLYPFGHAKLWRMHTNTWNLYHLWNTVSGLKTTAYISKACQKTHPSPQHIHTMCTWNCRSLIWEEKTTSESCWILFSTRCVQFHCDHQTTGLIVP